MSGENGVAKRWRRTGERRHPSLTPTMISLWKISISTLALHAMWYCDTYLCLFCSHHLRHTVCLSHAIPFCFTVPFLPHGVFCIQCHLGCQGVLILIHEVRVEKLDAAPPWLGCQHITTPARLQRTLFARLLLARGHRWLLDASSMTNHATRKRRRGGGGAMGCIRS